RLPSRTEMLSRPPLVRRHQRIPRSARFKSRRLSVQHVSPALRAFEGFSTSSRLGRRLENGNQVALKEVSMSDWIKTRADEIRRKTEEDRVERVRKADFAADLKAKIQPFWNNLASDLKEAARRFNEEFPEKERQIDQVDPKEPTLLVIRRSNYPVVNVKIQLTTAGTAVQYTISLTRRKGADVIEQQGTFA